MSAVSRSPEDYRLEIGHASRRNRERNIPKELISEAIAEGDEKELADGRTAFVNQWGAPYYTVIVDADSQSVCTAFWGLPRR